MPGSRRVWWPAIWTGSTPSSPHKASAVLSPCNDPAFSCFSLLRSLNQNPPNKTLRPQMLRTNSQPYEHWQKKNNNKECVDNVLSISNFFCMAKTKLVGKEESSAAGLMTKRFLESTVKKRHCFVISHEKTVGALALWKCLSLVSHHREKILCSDNASQFLVTNCTKTRHKIPRYHPKYYDKI